MSVEYQPKRRELWRLGVAIGVAMTGIPLIEEAREKDDAGNKDYGKGLGKIGTNDRLARQDRTRAKGEFRDRDIFGGTAIADEVAAVGLITMWAVRRWTHRVESKAEAKVRSSEGK